jgi:phage FluMu protein Com
MNTQVVLKPVKKRRKYVPVLSGELRYGPLKEIHCAAPECGKFLGYEQLQIGMIRITCHECSKQTDVTTLPDELPISAKLGEVRCPTCGRYLYSEAIIEGIVKVKCPNCHNWNLLDIVPDKE